MSASIAAVLIRTTNYAATKHGHQLRKATRLPYITHPIGVANQLVDAGVEDVAVLQAALLHDVVEDTGTSIDEVEQTFGSAVAEIVAQVTDDKTLSKTERKRHQIEHAKHCSKEAKLVKLSDKLNNLRDLTAHVPLTWTLERAQGYFVWSKFVVEGMRGTNSVLEAQLEELFKANFKAKFDGKTHPHIPNDGKGEFEVLLCWPVSAVGRP
jgi:hypothetical protein